ncbi:phosphatidylinositol-specific phospholipase C domain-containing protein [Shewanella sp. YLB-07]|uniref:phosphatidylinositol-specific phospholipase C domain-containing protein n=1 Tax=Shewanella sp. YLB-07 TaxID=2601268 RepID=UPI001883193B|nr:phosphatidylinositol-specific phospholipase C domain-containing protein [Shewanella sp. YLB-07]
MKILFFLFFISTAPLAHYDDAYHHSREDLPYKSTWMIDIPESKSIYEISIPGTHRSGNIYGGPINKTQTLSITQQLNSGIRFLDIELIHKYGSFVVPDGTLFHETMFGEILDEVSLFLLQNPSEFIFINVSGYDKHKNKHNDRSFKDTFNDYVNRYSNIIWSNDGIIQTIESARGKIVFIQDLPNVKNNKFGVPYSSFDTQDSNFVSTNWKLYSKWEKVKSQLIKSDIVKSKTMNYLNASGGSFPYFVASGHSSPGTNSPRLATGLTTPWWKHSYKDFPRVSCFIGFCTIAFEGTNVLTTNWIVKHQPSYTGIVVSDFPGVNLINAVINANFSTPPPPPLEDAQVDYITGTINGNDVTFNVKLTAPTSRERVLSLNFSNENNSVINIDFSSLSYVSYDKGQTWPIILDIDNTENLLIPEGINEITIRALTLIDSSIDGDKFITLNAWLDEMQQDKSSYSIDISRSYSENSIMISDMLTDKQVLIEGDSNTSQIIFDQATYRNTPLHIQLITNSAQIWKDLHADVELIYIDLTSTYQYDINLINFKVLNIPKDVSKVKVTYYTLDDNIPESQEVFYFSAWISGDKENSFTAETTIIDND